jgi:hypothetical protein
LENAMGRGRDASCMLKVVVLISIRFRSPRIWFTRTFQTIAYLFVDVHLRRSWKIITRTNSTRCAVDNFARVPFCTNSHVVIHLVATESFVSQERWMECCIVVCIASCRIIKPFIT